MLSAVRTSSRFPVVALLLVASLLVGCSPSTVVATLEAVTLSAEIAVSVLSAGGVGVDPQIVKYIGAVGDATTQTATLLQNGETGAKLAADIVAVFQDVVPPTYGPNVSPKVRAVVDAVAAAVKSLLLHFSSPAAVRALASSGATAPFKASATDKRKLGSLHKRAAAAAAAAAKLPAS